MGNKKTSTFVWMNGDCARVWCRSDPPTRYEELRGYVATVKIVAVLALTCGIEGNGYCDGPVEVV